MAADILVYRATHVPVGDDQKQHLELTRDIAIKFNNDFSERIGTLGLGVEIEMGEERVNGYFPITEPLIEGPATRVMSLRDGTKKMSKSDPSDLSRINLTDDGDAIAKKIKKAKTDPEPLPSELEGLVGRPEAAVLGVPTIFINPTSRCYLDEQRDRYALCTSARNYQEALPLVADMLYRLELEREAVRAEWRASRARMLEDVIDVASFARDFVEQHVAERSGSTAQR